MGAVKNANPNIDLTDERMSDHEDVSIQAAIRGAEQDLRISFKEMISVIGGLSTDQLVDISNMTKEFANTLVDEMNSRMRQEAVVKEAF